MKPLVLGWKILDLRQRGFEYQKAIPSPAILRLLVLKHVSSVQKNCFLYDQGQSKTMAEHALYNLQPPIDIDMFKAFSPICTIHSQHDFGKFWQEWAHKFQYISMKVTIAINIIYPLKFSEIKLFFYEKPKISLTLGM